MGATLLRGGVLIGRAAIPASLLIRDGRLTWIGPTEADDDARGLATEVVDLDGALVTTAFVDAHAHVTETGLALTGLDLTAVRSARELLDAVASSAAASPAGLPLLGHGWDDTSWADPELPTANELDAAAPGRDVYLSRIDVHSALVGARLADRCHAATLPGWGPAGRVERDAHHAVRRAARALTPERRRAVQTAALSAAARAGIALVHEMAAPDISGADDLQALLHLAGPEAGADEEFPLVVALWAEDVADVEQARSTRAVFGPGLLGLGGDLNVDGSFGSRTAALALDYADAPGHRGHLYRDAARIADHVEAVTRAGLQASFHAIGDAAVAEALAGYQEAAARVGRSRFAAARHRVEHAEAADEDVVTAMAALGVVAGVQPAFDATWAGPDGMYARRLGRARADATNPFAAFAAAGVVLAFGSDSPVTPFDPWGALAAAMRPHVADHGIGIELAWRAHTVAGWWAAHRDGGVLAPGEPAHLAIWSPSGSSAWSPSAADGQPACLGTMRDGRWLWRDTVLEG